MNSLLLTNAHLVTPKDHFLGSIYIEKGRIADIQKDKIYAEGIDLQGSWLVPGCIDIHSDYIEKEIRPRASAHFPVPFAVHFMDARAAACGITTLFSAIAFSHDEAKNRNVQRAIDITREVDRIRPQLLMRHFLHARMNPNTDGILPFLEEINKLESLYLVVYNDSTPGQRQFPLEHYIREYAKRHLLPEDQAKMEINAEIERLKNVNHRGEIQEILGDTHIIGSHDDTTIAHVEEAYAFGATLSEMPTTLIAARKAKELGMWVCMGAPNYYRGGSHCGNLACHEAMEEGVVDMLCSDYHFPTLLGSFIKMIQQGVAPNVAINYVSLHPAKLLKINDELGSIEIGKKADLVCFDIRDEHPLVKNVWIEGMLRYQTYYPIIPTVEHSTVQTGKVDSRN